MGGSASRAVDSAADSVSNATGSVRNDIDNTFGHTNSIQNASNRSKNLGTSISRGAVNSNEGIAPDGRYSDPVGGAFGHIFGYNAITTKVNPAHHKNITKHQDTKAHHNKHIPHVKASKSTQNTTHHKTKH